MQCLTTNFDSNRLNIRFNKGGFALLIEVAFLRSKLPAPA